MSFQALAHKKGDQVAVAVEDLEAGRISVKFLDGSGDVQLQVIEPVPLSHKVALSDIEKDQAVIEYGERIGVATQLIKQGGYVHTHNLKSARWAA